MGPQSSPGLSLVVTALELEEEAVLAWRVGSGGYSDWESSGERHFEEGLKLVVFSVDDCQ